MIFKFLLDVVRQCPPEAALAAFKALFVEYRADPDNQNAFTELERLLTDNEYEPFAHTLKRCCYILINNWGTARQLDCINTLVELLVFPEGSRSHHDRQRKRLEDWLERFTKSEDYQDLQLFAATHTRQTLAKYETDDAPQVQPQHWSDRYHSYLLVPQYVDTDNSPEQRNAARTLSKQLKDQFKFDLAMYTARSQTLSSQETPPKNPTGLGDDVLRLVKSIVAKRSQFSHQHLARIFLRQVEGLEYGDFKLALQNYLIVSPPTKTKSSDLLTTRIQDYLAGLYEDKEDWLTDTALVLRTCNRVLDVLSTQDGQYPTELFCLLLTEGKTFTLVITLLKVILVSPNSRPHLEKRIAELIKYYMQFPESECDGVIRFFEMFNIAFAIHGDEDVQYSLIPVSMHRVTSSASKTDTLAGYRVFSQYKDGYSPNLTS